MLPGLLFAKMRLTLTYRLCLLPYMKQLSTTFLLELLYLDLFKDLMPNPADASTEH